MQDFILAMRNEGRANANDIRILIEAMQKDIMAEIDKKIAQAKVGPLNVVPRVRCKSLGKTSTHNLANSTKATKKEGDANKLRRRLQPKSALRKPSVRKPVQKSQTPTTRPEDASAQKPTDATPATAQNAREGPEDVEAMIREVMECTATDPAQNSGIRSSAISQPGTSQELRAHSDTMASALDQPFPTRRSRQQSTQANGQDPKTPPVNKSVTSVSSAGPFGHYNKKQRGNKRPRPQDDWI